MSTATRYSGSKLLDEDGQTIGTIRDVVYEDIDDPAWLVVKPGWLRAEHFVPTAGAYRTESDNIVVPYSAHQVRSAPKAAHDHVLVPGDRERLVEHYGLDAIPSDN